MSGFDVIRLAKNGEEAISMYESFSEKADIVLIAHRMPIKDELKILDISYKW